MILEGFTITACYEERTLQHYPSLNCQSSTASSTGSTTEAVSVCHSAAQESPVPTYVGLMLHCERRIW